MPALTPEIANEIVRSRPDAEARLKKDGTGHLQYGYRYLFKGPNMRDICVARRGTADGATVYINKQSCALEDFPAALPERYFSGVGVAEEYRKGSTGRTGDKGLSTAAASCPTLDPAKHNVLRLSCSNQDGFERLVRWYAGDFVLGLRVESPPSSATAVTELSGPVAAAIAPFSGSPTDPDAASLGAIGVDGPQEIMPAANGPAAAMSDDEARLIMSDPAKRRAVERHAVDLAIKYYKGLGFDIQELGKPFDLLCTPTAACLIGSTVVHVEVKGSVGPARTVHLTRNEVNDARAGEAWRSDLYIVSNIELVSAPSSDSWSASGGAWRLFADWCPKDDDLRATDFAYRVPI
jgi:hypothetical protein